MEGTARVFAGDFSKAAYSMPGYERQSSSYVLTPGGAWCNRVFVAGALTEVTDHGTVIRSRLADPTGTFTLEIVRDGRTELPGLFGKLTVPAFLVITGTARLTKGNGGCSAIIRPESVQIVDRSVRDWWVLTTAESTLRRAGALAAALKGEEAAPAIRAVIGKYQTTPEQILEILSMVESALSSLAPETTTAPQLPERDPRGIIITIIRDLQGPRGVATDEVIAQARIRGIPPEEAQGVIADLIREDECYQPQKGSLRLL